MVKIIKILALMCGIILSFIFPCHSQDKANELDTIFELLDSERYSEKKPNEIKKFQNRLLEDYNLNQPTISQHFFTKTNTCVNGGSVGALSMQNYWFLCPKIFIEWLSNNIEKFSSIGRHNISCVFDDGTVIGTQFWMCLLDDKGLRVHEKTTIESPKYEPNSGYMRVCDITYNFLVETIWLVNDGRTLTYKQAKKIFPKDLVMQIEEIYSDKARDRYISVLKEWIDGHTSELLKGKKGLGSPEMDKLVPIIIRKLKEKIAEDNKSVKPNYWLTGSPVEGGTPVIDEGIDPDEMPAEEEDDDEDDKDDEGMSNISNVTTPDTAMHNDSNRNTK